MNEQKHDKSPQLQFELDIADLERQIDPISLCTEAGDPFNDPLATD